MCGKNSAATCSTALTAGSPPHVREKPILNRQKYSRLRITPACAGKTLSSRLLADALKDHPRMCGKNYRVRMLMDRVAGSPPHVREKLRSCNCQRIFSRITPACAGKTMATLQFRRIIQDHPRVCGKNDLTKVIEAAMTGSPPRVREKPRFFAYIGTYHRITPACAGKTT